VVDEALCSICGNVARDESEYCEHVKSGMKGQVVAGKLCHELNRGVRFFEVSLISPYSEAADGAAKIKQTLASKETELEGFEDWITEDLDSDITEADITSEIDDAIYQFGELVRTQDGKEGIIIGLEGNYPRVVTAGNKDSQLFDPNTLTTVEEVNKMAKEFTKVAQGEGKEEYGMDKPMKGNPTNMQWHGDYGSPAEKFKQDYNRTEVDSDDVNLRGSQVSSQQERGDYLHRGTTADGETGWLPKKASVEDLEKQLEDHLENTAETAVILEEYKQKEAVKKGFMSKVKQVLGIEREAAEDFGMDTPARGNPSSMKDAGDYQESEKYYNAQKAEGDTKLNETKKDIDNQRPLTYSNTPENLYSKLPKVAMSVKEIVEKVKEAFEDEKEAQAFVKAIQGLKKEEADDVLDMLSGAKEEEDKEMDKEDKGDKDKGEDKDKEEPSKPSGPPMPPKSSIPPIKPMGPPTPPKPAMPPAGPPKPSAPPGMGAPKPGSPPMGLSKLPMASVQHVRMAIAHKKLAALGDWGNEDPVLHAKRMILQQITRNPSTNPESMFMLAANIRNLDSTQQARLARELNMPIGRTASLDYSNMSNPELVGVYKYIQASSDTEAENSILRAMVERGIKVSSVGKIAVSWPDVVSYVIEERKKGRSYNEVKAEIDDKFDIVSSPDKENKENAMGPGGTVPGPGSGSASDLGNKEPSDGRTIGEGGGSQPGIWAGRSPREMNEREIGRSSALKNKTAAGELNDYDITVGTGTRWNAETKSLADSVNVEQKRDFGSELKEARRLELLAREAAKDPKVKAREDKIKKEKEEKAKKEKADKEKKDKEEKAKKAKTAASGEHFYDLSTNIAPKAPSSQLANQENSKQDSELKSELKQAVGTRVGQPIKVVSGTGDEHMATVSEVTPEIDTIAVDYDDIRNRDIINLAAGKSKVYGAVKVYIRPEIVTVKKANWVAYGDGKAWNLYNFKRSASKLAVVKLADVDPEEVAKDFSLETTDTVPEFFASKAYGEAVLDQAAEAESNGQFDTNAGTGMTDMAAGTDEDIAVGEEVIISPEWLPTGEETDELMNDVINLKNDNVPGTVEQITSEGAYVVNFGGDTPIVLTASEIKSAKDSGLTLGTDVRWTDETKALSDDANGEQTQEFTKEQVLSSFGPDSQRHSVMASKQAWSEPIQFMSTLIKDAGMKVKEALGPTIEAFEMTEEDTDSFVNSDEYVAAFETPISDIPKGDPEFGDGKEVTQMRAKMAGLKKRLCIRIAEDMADKGMIQGLSVEADEDSRTRAIDNQVNTLMKLDQSGLYEFESAVKSASDPDGIEGMKRASRVGPEQGTLKEAMIMRGASKSTKDDLDNPDFFM
jgi:hypothetical protein